MRGSADVPVQPLLHKVPGGGLAPLPFGRRVPRSPFLTGGARLASLPPQNQAPLASLGGLTRRSPKGSAESVSRASLSVLQPGRRWHTPRCGEAARQGRPTVAWGKRAMRRPGATHSPLPPKTQPEHADAPHAPASCWRWHRNAKGILGGTLVSCFQRSADPTYPEGEFNEQPRTREFGGTVSGGFALTLGQRSLLTRRLPLCVAH